MLRHVLSLFSAPAYLCGIICVAALLSGPGRGWAWRRASFRADADATRSNASVLGRAVLPAGAACALASFFFLPAGSFPAYAESDAPMAFWFVLFGIACAALAFAMPRQEARSARALLVTPVFLAAVYAVCARYAWLRGFPGEVWNMESFVGMPLISGAGLVRGSGIFCLAAAAILHCSSALAMRDDAPFLRACLCLAVAQFIICLFFPILPSRFFVLSPVAAFVADYGLYWGLSAALLLLAFPLAAGFDAFRLLPLVLAVSGSALCLL